MFRVAILLLCVLVSGCSTLWARYAYTFKTIETVPRINYQGPVQDIAEKIADNLEGDMKHVIDFTGQPFKNADALEIFVFESKEKYAKYSSSSPKARGSATKNEIYISPIIRERIHTLGPIVRHELSHSHLRQYVGTLRYWIEIPGWFHEGIGVLVSNGGGAETVSEEEARQALRAGTFFVPRSKSSILGHKYASDYNMKPHLYYRQCANFVMYLRELSPKSFNSVYFDLINGHNFEVVWAKHYGKDMEKLWSEYLNKGTSD